MAGNAILVNFAGGETSPKSRGRFDLPWFGSSCRKLLNFIAEVAGPARYRPAFKVARETRGGAVARSITFQLNNNLSYELEFTPGYLRAYKNFDLVTLAPQTITGITQANPAVITCSAIAGMANGTDVILAGIAGMKELNGRQVKLAGGAGLTFQLVDAVTGAGIDSTGFSAYTSGGAASPIYELVTPYSAADLKSIEWAATNTVMYLVCPTQEPRKLTVDSSDAFALNTFVRTHDPFGTAGPAITLTALFRGGELWNGSPDYPVQANTTIVEFSAGDLAVDGQKYSVAGVVGTVELNGNAYVAVAGVISSASGGPDHGPVLYLRNAADLSQVDSRTFGAYVGGGTFTPKVENPISVAFYEGRLGYFGTNQRPSCFFLSRSPDDNGNERYDDFTGGTNADHACFFQLAPVSGSVDYISWARGGPDYLFVGSFGGPYRVSGSGLDIPITPSSINVRQFDSAGCEETMAAGCAQIFFIQRGGTTLRSIKVINPYLATVESVDFCANAEQIPAESPLQRVVLQQGRPDVLWVVREDGLLCGMTVKITAEKADSIAGWHRHKLGGTNAKVLDIAVAQRTTGLDVLWAVTERTVGGVTRRFMEYMADDVSFPDLEDFFTGDEAADLERFNNAVYRRQEQYIHLDGAATYNGSDRGVTAGATLTPGAVTGDGIVFAASQDVFKATDVGSQLWKKPDADTGVGAGRATIVGYTDAKHVTVDVTVDFDSAAAIDAGEWHFAVNRIYGLGYQEGERVAVVTDGAVYSDGKTDDYPAVTVARGSIALVDDQVGAVIHAGYPYVGFLETHNLEIGGRSGPAQAKPRNISTMFIRFMNSLGVEFGTDLYSLEKVNHRRADGRMDRPAPVFSGLRKLPYSDSWQAEEEKRVVVVQRLPVPAIVEFVNIEYDTADEE